MYETQYSYYINPATKKFLQTNEAHSPITTPPSFYFGDRPKFTLSFPADTIAEGDTLIAVLDNENRFLDTKQATGLNPVMAGVLHEVTSEEADSQSLEIQLFDYSKKFADVINGHDNAVTCLFTVYLKATDGEGNFTFIELGQTIANGEPTVTSPECVWDDLPVTKYYTREELDAVYNQFLAGVSLVVEYSNLAKSYAVGGTGTREGEDTDNAKYYAEMASQAANAVSTMYASIQTLATQIANTKEYIDGLVESIAIDIRDISEIAASVTSAAAQVSRDSKSVRQAKSSVDASVQFVSQAKSTIENLATQVSQNAVNVSNDKDTVAQLAVQVSNAASQVSRDKADAKGYSESAATSLANVQTIQTDVTQKQTAVTTMKNTIQRWYNQISSWYNSIQSFMEQMQGWWTDVDTWQQQVSEDKDTAETARNEAVTAKNNAVTAKTAAETAQTKAETAQTKAETAQTKAEEARDEAISTLANKRDILQTLVTSSATSLVVEAGKSYNWTVSAASTISMKAADKVANKETRIDIYIDLQDGGSVTGNGVAVADAVLQSGWYKLIWDGTNATLYSTKAGGAASVITIPASTTSYTLLDNKNYQQTPSAVPTYTLPTASFDGLVHEITVLVDFLHVTSCSFVDASGVPVTLQSAISPSIGEAYIFRCYWYGKWRVVPLKIRNAATVSSATGVVEVSDAVAGDALALKMTAPRSVVVNQLVAIPNTSQSITENNVTITDNRDGTYTVSTTSEGASAVTRIQFNLLGYYTPVIGHTVFFWGCPSGGTLNTYRLYVDNNNYGGFDIGDGCSFVIGTTNYLRMFIDIRQGCVITTPITFRPQFIDLTQYFNGDSALIDSITSWDDLVAYDPRFAQYVEYNTGTVTGVQPQVKVTGKNLFDVSQLTTVTGNIIIANGVVSCQKYSCSSNKNLNQILMSAKVGMTYTISADITINSGPTPAHMATGRIAVSSGGILLSELAQGLPAGTYHKSNTFILTSKMLTGNVYFYGQSNMPDNIIFSNIQIEAGSQATSYEPYHDGGTATAPEELFAVGNAADEFEAVAGVTTRKIVSYTFTGNENIFLSSNPTTYLVNIPNKAIGKYSVVCDRLFTVSSMQNWAFIANMECIGSGDSRHIYFRNDTWTSASDVKATLTGLTVYFSLATPTTSQSTPTQISLQAGHNVAMQTDGGRTLAELAMTYENLPAAD